MKPQTCTSVRISEDRMTNLTPHSKEWFAALAKVNPQEAAHTKQIVKSAGTPDVCSYCGGEPARDYLVTNKWFTGSIPATFRLCEDCLSLRATNEGETFAPLQTEYT
jgi:hypothetical protein